MKRVIAMMVICCGAAVFAEHFPVERYNTIKERKMFGPEPEGFDPTKSAAEARAAQKSARGEEKVLTQDQEKLKSAIHFSVINVTPEGETMVGFTDNSIPKEQHHYYLKVGEEKDGWKVKEADAIAKTMTIVKDDIEVALTLGGNSASGAGSTSRAKRGATVSSSARKLGGLMSNGGAANMAADQAGVAQTLRERKALRKKARELDEAAQAERARVMEEARQEEARKKEEAEAIRKAKDEETKRELADLRQSFKRMQEEQAAAAEAAAAAEQAAGKVGARTLEENGNGGEAPVEEGGEE
jgi:hypothetical protein